MVIILNGMMINGQELPLLKISKDHNYIETTENKPFLWLGGTAWELIHRLNKEEIDLYLEDRARKGFTIIQTVILAELDGLNTPNAYGHRPLINNNPETINEQYFELVDYVLKKSNELGMYVGLLPTWGDKFNLKWGVGPVIFNPNNAKIFGEILAKRYHNQKNIIWILGGDRMAETKQQHEIIQAMAAGIQKYDQNHLMTYHPSGGNLATDNFNEDWLNFDMFQSGHDRSAKEYNFVFKSKSVLPKRPVIEAEPRYENSLERFWEPGEHDWMDDSDVRATAYSTLLAGAAGYTYGCHDIWQMYTMDKKPVNGARTGWKVALNLPGSQQIFYLKNLFNSLPWYELVNDQSLILSKNIEGEKYIISSIGNKKDMIIAYTPWGLPIQLNLSKLNSKQLKAYWFNPRSGQSIFIGNFDIKDTPIFDPWAQGRGSDFILVILDSNSTIKLPNLIN